MDAKNILIIFVKYPKQGFVKTRLAKSIGYKKALLLYKIFVKSILKRTGSKAFERMIFYTPKNKRSEIKRWLGNEFKFLPQQGKTLGHRLLNSFQKAFSIGAKRIVIIGTDSPLLDKKQILKAFRELKNVDCVIGPSLDGGYYLIGLTQRYKNLFLNIPWGTNRVLEATLQKLNRLDLKYSLLDKNFDVDNKEDLGILKKRLRDMKVTDKAGLVNISNTLQKFRI